MTHTGDQWLGTSKVDGQVTHLLPTAVLVVEVPALHGGDLKEAVSEPNSAWWRRRFNEMLTAQHSHSEFAEETGLHHSHAELANNLVCFRTLDLQTVLVMGIHTGNTQGACVTVAQPFG